MLVTSRRMMIGVVVLLMVVMLPQWINESREQEVPSLNAEQIESLRVEYPLYNQMPPLYDGRLPSFEEIVHRSESLVLAEVVQALSDTEFVLSNPLADNPEWNEKKTRLGLEDAVLAYERYELSVIRFIAGKEIEGRFILLSLPWNSGYEPQYKPGMKVILPLGPESGDRAGMYSTSKFGFFYVIDDTNVLTAVEHSSIDRWNGEPVSKVIQAIQEMKKT
ncbi:hypothetical protein DX130_16485 [Paenibacillus paeoniae]|uniref:Uncharacterized protein n=2 Tax=Paenibacillus paeoniae TaxID=2292705 RepID=A0A371PE19_9BACL|nr:hypothetical protein DX130_16485 [Paenibacillus paeoniae]